MDKEVKLPDHETKKIGLGGYLFISPLFMYSHFKHP